MLFVDDIVKIIKIGIVSGCIKNEKTYFNPILLGNPEIGKTTILTNFNFHKLKQVFPFTDLTKTKIEKFLKDMQNPHPIKYIIIPDFTMLMSHSKSVEKGLIGILNAGIEEGLREITMHHGGSNIETVCFKEPLRFGMATSATKQFIGDRRRISKWHSIGFWSRLTPISFSYTKEQAREIRDYIAGGHDVEEIPEEIKVKPSNIECKKKYVKKFDSHIDRLADAALLYGFRYTKQFRIMLKSAALIRGSKKVSESDVKEVMKLTRWINLEYNTVI